MIQQLLKHKTHILTGLFIAILQMMLPVWAEITVTPEQIGEKVEAYLLENMPIDDPDAVPHVEIVKLPIAPIVLEGDTVAFMLDDSRSTPYTSRTIVQVTMSTEGESRRIGIPVRLSMEKPVWVANRLIQARESITRKDVILQTKRVDYGIVYSLGAKEDITAYTSKVNIPPGSVLDARKLVLTPAVYRNDNVQLVLAMGNGVQIKVSGKALEDGAIGKRIRVVQQMRDRKIKTYVGEVIDRNTVLVKI
jgi:flagella basal body P-ring formation protein FlgA